MAGFFTTLLILAVGTIVLVLVQRRFDADERLFIWISFFAHVVGAVAQVVLTRYFYGGGDMLTYFGRGQALAEWLAAQPAEHAWRLLRLLFHDPDV